MFANIVNPSTVGIGRQLSGWCKRSTLRECGESNVGSSMDV